MSFEHSDHLYSVENKRESTEFERHLEDLLSHYKRINEGEEGIIALIDLNEYEPEALQEFFGEDVLKEIGSDKRLAVKMLKVYIDGRRAIEEGNLQKEAREALVEGGVTDVLIPRVYYNDELEITSPALRAELESDDVHLKDNKAGIILMDLVPGQDISDYILKEVVKRNPDLQEFQDPTTLDSLDYRNLESIVGIALGQQHISDQEDAYSQKQKEKENDKLLVNFLSRTDFILNPEILSRLENALWVLHKAGIYHRDLHKRNLMFNNTKEGNLDKVYIIDFGKSVKTRDTSKDDVYIEDDTIYKEDEYLIRTFKSLTRPRSDQEKEAYFASLANPLNAIKQSEKRKKDYSKFSSSITKKLDSLSNSKKPQEVMKKIDNLITEFSNVVYSETTSEQNFNLQLALWHELVSQAPESVPYILISLRDIQKRNSNRSPYFNNQVVSLIEYIEEEKKLISK